MGNIRYLSNDIISQIAAGEVIERPSYIVKELIENAIDAQATSIQIQVEGYGMDKIVVTDNGVGMDEKDISLCFERFTTSKLRKSDDFYQIKLLGFRGEALASIAATSDVIIRSRPHSSQTGFEVTLHQGASISRLPKGMPLGTQIVVSDVFSAVPVRKKFLKSPGFEYRSILEIVHRYCYSYPKIRFDLTHNGKRVITYIERTDNISRMMDMIPSSISQHILPIHRERDAIQIRGYIGKPQISYKTHRAHYLYVNNRFFKDSKIAMHIKKAYGTLLEPGSYPFALIFIDLPPQFVDVNVHPKKESVLFLTEERIYSLLHEAIHEVLIEANLHFFDKRYIKKSEETAHSLRKKTTKTHAATILKREVLSEKSVPYSLKAQDIIQIHNLYLLFPTDEGFSIIDQHAAHERILYEKFLLAFQDKKQNLPSIKLSPDVILDLPSDEYELLKEKSKDIASLGFTLMFVKNHISVTHVPEVYKDRDICVLFREILDDLWQYDGVNLVDAFTTTMVEYLSCRSAIKAGDILTQIEAKRLIEDLRLCDNPYTCPHGRPIQVEMELPYLHTLFKRT